MVIMRRFDDCSSVLRSFTRKSGCVYIGLAPFVRAELLPVPVWDYVKLSGKKGHFNFFKKGVLEGVNLPSQKIVLQL